MRLYIAVVESDRRRGRRVKIAVHARSIATARRMVASRWAKWTLRILKHKPGPACINFQDEFSE